jgi:hypothetical protein
LNDEEILSTNVLVPASFQRSNEVKKFKRRARRKKRRHECRFRKVRLKVEVERKIKCQSNRNSRILPQLLIIS